MKKQDRQIWKIIEWGLIALIVFAPIPAASVHQWSVLVIQLTVILLMIGYYLGATERLHPNKRLNLILKWPGYLFIGFWAFVVFQILPLPKFLTRFLAPNTYAFHALHNPEFSSTTFLSVSIIPSHTLKMGLALLSYFLIGFLIVKTIKRRSQIFRMFFVIFIMGVFEAFYGMIQRYSSSSSFLSGTFISRNHFAGYLEMIVPVGIGLILTQTDLTAFVRLKWREKLIGLADKRVAFSLLLLFGVILMSLALVFSRSRSAAFILVFVFSLFFLLTFLRSGQNKEQKKGMRIFLISVFIIIICVSMYVGLDVTFKRFALDRLLQESRPVIWAQTLELFIDSPIIGTGLGTFAALLPNMEGDGRLAKVTHAHNDYLEYLTELGVIGMCLLLGGIFLILRNSFKLWLRKRHPVMRGLGTGGLVAIAAILVHGITDFNLHIPCNMMLFSVILSLTLVTVTYRPPQRKK